MQASCASTSSKRCCRTAPESSPSDTSRTPWGPSIRFSGSCGAPLGAAIEYIEALGLDRIGAHERDVLAYGTRALMGIPGLQLTGTAKERAGILAFVLDGVHPHDVGTIVDREGVAIRTGHHCCQPL